MPLNETEFSSNRKMNIQTSGSGILVVRNIQMFELCPSPNIDIISVFLLLQA